MGLPPPASRPAAGRRERTRSRCCSKPPASRTSMPRGRKTVLSITLTPDERETLLTWQRSTTIRVGRARRGQIMLLLGAGMPMVKIAGSVGVTHRVLYKWAQRFLRDAIAGLAAKPAPGRGPVLTQLVILRRASRST